MKYLAPITGLSKKDAKYQIYLCAIDDRIENLLCKMQDH